MFFFEKTNSIFSKKRGNTVSKKKKAVATNEDKLYTPVEKEEYASIVEDLYEEVTEKLAELKGTKKPKTEILIQDKVDNLIGAVKNKEYHSAHKNNKLRKVIRDSYTPTEEAKTPFLIASFFGILCCCH